MDSTQSPQQPLNIKGTRMRTVLHSTWLLLLFTIIISMAFFFYRLDSYPMQNWDEGVHSQVTREMLQTKDYWSLHYQGQDYFRKPPLKIWLTAPMISVFGEHNWVFRFWSAFAGVGIAVLMALFIRRSSGKLLMAYIAVAIFASGQFILYHSFRTGEMDALFLLFMVAGLFCYWKSENSPRWLIGAGIMFALGIMSKSVAGFIGPIIMVSDILLRRKWNVFSKKEFWVALSAFAAVMLPWHISQIVLHGKAFWDEYIGFHVVDRTFEQLYADLPIWWYVKMCYLRLFPFSLFLIGALPLTVYQYVKLKDRIALLFLLWFLLPIILFTVVKTKFEWYILPVYPAAAWIMSRYFVELIKRYKEPFFIGTALVSAYLTLAFLPSAVIPGAKTWWFTIQAYVPKIISNISYSKWWLPLIVIGILVIILLLLRKKRYAGGIVTAMFMVFMIFFSVVRTAGTIATQPTQSIFLEVASMLQDFKVTDVVLFQTDLYGKPAGYYEIASNSRKVQYVPRAHTTPNSFLTSNSYILTSADALPSVETTYTLIASKGQYHLYAPITEQLKAR